MNGPQARKPPSTEPLTGCERLNRLIAEVLDAEAAGRPVDREALLRQHSDLADQLRAFFAEHDRLRQLADAAAGSPPGQPNEPSGRGPVRPSWPRRFGDYELLEEISRGGMGVVYKARQLSLNRVVALKMMLSRELADQKELARFQREAEAAARLDHPGIVPVFDVGQVDGLPYFSMGYVEGETLADRLRRGPVRPREAAVLLCRTCDAVQYAHEHGVIHRDLKPSNILLARRTSNAADSQASAPSNQPSGGAGTSDVSLLDVQPRVADFGLAKQLTSGRQLTGTGEVLGTPAYMSPEQASGQTDRVGPASDVYSLGAILYHMLTGRPPFLGETPLEVLQKVVDCQPIPPRSLNRSVPRQLEAICLKCLHKDPSQRYGSARELQQDLQRFLDGEPVEASSLNVLARIQQTLARSRYEEQFRGWGLALVCFGAVILATHLVLFWLERDGATPLEYWLPRLLMYVALLALLRWFRPHSLLPRSSAERLVWVVWLGYLLALASAVVTLKILGVPTCAHYSVASVLSGLGFLVMGAHVWGGGYAVGLAFLLAAPVLAALKTTAPLVFGLLWAAALTVFGLRYWRAGTDGS